MDFLGVIAGGFIVWMWWDPHEFGQWVEKVKDPYRQKPMHQKKRKAK